MSLDIRYRPRTYDDVLGQDATKIILKEYVALGRGFQQSYLFCGAHGSGKTTLGRILARALLCETPVKGAPCDACLSCKSLLEYGTSPDFSEVDAATNSGKAEITKVIDEIAYATFSGKRRIYLFDESHQLSRDALDALLKPLEENIAGSDDKRLVCIFCTTEPEKMRATVLSRCAPAFVIQPMQPEVIAVRLQHICEQENIKHDPAMLTLIAEITECHIRDALKAVEGVSMMGEVSQENVTSYLHLDLNVAYLDVIEHIGSNLPAAFQAAKDIMERASPLTCYKKLADVAMLAYRCHLGEKAPSHWGAERVVQLGHAKGEVLLGYVSRFASRPGRPTSAMLLCDIAHLHHVGGSVTNPDVVLSVATSTTPTAPAPSAVASTPVEPPSSQPDPPNSGGSQEAVRKPPPDPGTVSAQDKEYNVEQRAVNNKRGVDEPSPSTELEPQLFATLLQQALADEDGSGSGGPSGRNNMGGH